MLCSGVVSSNPLTDPFFWFSFMLPDAALEAEAAERAAAGDTAAGAAAGAAAGGGEGPLGSLQAASKGFNVLEYPMQPLPGSRSMMRRHQGSRNLSYNARYVGVYVHLRTAKFSSFRIKK